MTFFQKFEKRFFDLVVSAAGLTLLWPVVLVLWAAASIETRRNGFFTQKRVGRHGKIFRFVKIRSMKQIPGMDTHVTADKDPRITRLGRFLRKTKLDELPQLWNVLTGSMSLVGPRPEVPGYADRVTGESRRMLELRPGITGPATLFFRCEEDLLARVADRQKYNDEVLFPTKVHINCGYFDNWSFFRDFGYILVTIFPVFNRLFNIVPDPVKDPAQLEARRGSQTMSQE